MFDLSSLGIDDHCCLVFFFKQKTAYEMRISDWSSDVCSSDLRTPWVLTSASSRRVRHCSTVASSSVASRSCSQKRKAMLFSVVCADLSRHTSNSLMSLTMPRVALD